MTSLTGRTLSHYRLEEKIGSGGMGEVYRATDTRLDRQVAVKILPPDLLADDERRRRFSVLVLVPKEKEQEFIEAVGPWLIEDETG